MGNNKISLNTSANTGVNAIFTVADISYYDSANIQYQNLCKGFKTPKTNELNICFKNLETISERMPKKLPNILPKCNIIEIHPGLLFILPTLEWKIYVIMQTIKNPNSIITINESNKKYSRDQQREYVINKNKRSKEYIEKIENISYTCSNGIVSNIRNYIMKLFKIYE